MSRARRRRQQQSSQKKGKEKKPKEPLTLKARVKRAAVSVGVLAAAWGAGTFMYHKKEVEPFVDAVQVPFNSAINDQNYKLATEELSTFKKELDLFGKFPKPIEHFVFPYLQRDSLIEKLEGKLQNIHPEKTYAQVTEWVERHEKNGSTPTRSELKKWRRTLGMAKNNYAVMGEAAIVSEITAPGGVEARVLGFDAYYAIDDLRNTYLSTQDKDGNARAMRMLLHGGAEGIDPEGYVDKKWSILMGGAFLSPGKKREAKEVLDHLYLYQSGKIFEDMKKEGLGSLTSRNQVSVQSEEGEEEVQTAVRMTIIESRYENVQQLRKDMEGMHNAIGFDFKDPELDVAGRHNNTIPTEDPFPLMTKYLENSYLRYIDELSGELTDVSRELRTKGSEDLESNIVKMHQVIVELRDLETRHKKYLVGNDQADHIQDKLDGMQDKIKKSSQDLIEGALTFLGRSIKEYEISEQRDEKKFEEYLQNQVNLVKNEVELYESSGGNSVKAEEYLGELSTFLPQAYARFVVAERTAAKDVIGRIGSKQISVDDALEEIDTLYDNAQGYLKQVYETQSDLDVQKEVASIVKEIESLKTVAQCQGSFIVIDDKIEELDDKTEYDEDSHDDLVKKLDRCEAGISTFKGTGESIKALQTDLKAKRKDVELAWATHAVSVASFKYKRFVGLDVDEEDKTTPSVYKTAGALAETVANEHLMDARKYGATKEEAKAIESSIKDAQDILKYEPIIASINKMGGYDCESSSLDVLESTIYEGLGDQRRKIRKSIGKLGKSNVETRQLLEDSINDATLKKYTECQDRAGQIYRDRKRSKLDPDSLIEALSVQREFLEIAKEYDSDLNEKLRRVNRDITRYEKASKNK